jgi:anaerobic selenocysteine-containing dehydrogenase
VLHSPNGLISAMAVHSLNVLVGAISRPGSVMFGDSPPLAPLHAPVVDATARAGLQHASVIGEPPPFGSADPAGRFAAVAARAANSPIDTLFLYYSNPLASAAHPKDWSAALERVPFVVSFSPFLDETTRFADLVLPDALPYERWQDAPTPPAYPYPVWGLVQPLVAPPPKTLPTGEVVLALARKLGGSVAESLPYEDVPALLQARARGLFRTRRGMTLGDRFQRTHYRQMEERGWWLAEQTDFDAFWKELVDRGGWTDLLYDGTDPARIARTASGRIELIPKALPRDAYAALRALDLRTNPPHDFPLRLLPYRVSTLASGSLGLEPWIAEQPSLTVDVHWVPWIEIHPTTAAAAGLTDGTMVWVVAPRGRYQARLRVFRGAALGHVHAPYGPRHADGSLANPFQILSDITDPLTGLVAWDATFVRLEGA